MNFLKIKCICSKKILNHLRNYVSFRALDKDMTSKHILKKEQELGFIEKTSKAYSRVSLNLAKPTLNLVFLAFNEWRPYHTAISQLICSANQWACFYMIKTLVVEKLNQTVIFETIDLTDALR